MPISIKDIPESTKKLLEWKWKQRGFKVSFPEFLALYVYAYNKAEEYGFSDPEITVLELLDKVDPDLSYDELKEETEGFLVPVSVPEFEELEYWKKKAQELERELKKAVPYRRFVELERKLKELERRLEEKEREIEELRREGAEVIRQRIRTFEEELKEYPTDELVTSYYALKTKPPELSEEEWRARREAIRKELIRRKVPRSPVTGEFLEPVTEWKGVRVPPELGFWYDPIQRMFYRDGRPVTPEAIDRALRQLYKPIKPPKPPYELVPYKPEAPPEVTPIEEELEIQPAFMPGETPPTAKQVRNYLKLIAGFIIRITGREPEQLSDEELERILNKLQPYYPRQVYYFKWYITTFRDWRERGLF